MTESFSLSFAEPAAPLACMYLLLCSSLYVIAHAAVGKDFFSPRLAALTRATLNGLLARPAHICVDQCLHLPDKDALPLLWWRKGPLEVSQRGWWTQP